MVLDVEPVADVPPVAVDREVLALEGVQHHQGNQLLRKLEGAIVVRAVGDERRQAEGAVVGAHQVVRARLRGRVGRVGGVGRRLREEPLGAERAVDLVGRDVEEAERLAQRFGRLGEVRPRAFEQLEGADDVGLEKGPRTVDRAVDVGLRREVEHRRRREFAVHTRHSVAVGDVALDKSEARAALEVLKILAAAGVGELVEHHHAGVALAERVAHEVRADEAGPAGHDPGVGHRFPFIPARRRGGPRPRAGPERAVNITSEPRGERAASSREPLPQRPKSG